MYVVRHKETKEEVFKASSLIQTEMVAIALALASHYASPAEYEVRQGYRTLNTISTDTAFGAMQTKMRNLIFNRKITSRMPYMPDRFTGLAHTKILKAAKKDRGMETVKNRLDAAVDEYAAYVKDSIT